MAAPGTPLEPMEIDVDFDASLAGVDARTMSQTRRLGSNAATEIELQAKLDAPPPPPPAPADPKTSGKPYLPGDLIQGKYRLTRIIGRGGMGAVWLAHNVPLDIEVAIKLIRRDRTAPGAADRLLTEARAAARLVHPAIVRVFDFGESEQGDPFIVMELLRGESLNAILRRKKRLTPAVAVQMLLPVAHALTSAHGKGIVHRDLKPDNIIVVTDETGALVPKIVDFGIAKLMSPDVNHQATMAGEVLGSPDYMSPEQARGSTDVGEATDVWTFSVVLYELVTGKRPFDGPNYNALIAAILTTDPAPVAVHGVTDAALSGIIEHGLAKDVTARWPRIRDLGAALASWAVANGIEEDVMGNPIAKQWLASAPRRLLTVQPETGEAPLRSGLVGPSVPPPSPSSRPSAPALNPVATPPADMVHARSAASVEVRRASARNALILVVAIVLLGGAALAVFLRSMTPTPSRPAASTPAVDRAPSATTATTATIAVATATPSTPATAEAAPTSSASAAPEPSISGSAAEPAASGAPSARPWKWRPPTKRAPPTPKNIKF